MLVEVHDDRLRLTRQQDHARLAGGLAHAWRPSPGDPSPLPYRLVWATGVHDAAWVGLDRTPVLDPDSGRPYDFRRLPLERKLGPYREGIDRVSELDPYAGLQVSRHYSSFLDADSGDDDVEAFLAAERERRAVLLGRLPRRLRGDALLDRELSYLKLFDTLSLYVCLAGPGSGGRPEWLVPGDRVETPTGREVALRWESRGRLLLDPSPLRGPLDLHVPYREIPPFHGSREELERSWSRSAPEHRTVRIR